MTRVTVEQFHCDICSNLGERFTLVFDGGRKIFDRCDKHDRKLRTLRDLEEGTFVADEPARRRNAFTVSSVQDIESRRVKRT